MRDWMISPSKEGQPGDIICPVGDENNFPDRDFIHVVEAPALLAELNRVTEELKILKEATQSSLLIKDLYATRVLGLSLQQIYKLKNWYNQNTKLSAEDL